IHLYMLEVAERHGFLFDAAQMPINVLDAHFRSFTRLVVPELIKRDIGVLAMKSMGDGVILKSNIVTPVECLHFALHTPASVVITGIDKPEILDQAMAAAQTQHQVTDEQIGAILAKTAEPAKDGRWELFKTSDVFDSTAKNLKWLGGVNPHVQAIAPASS
ncbi:MAG: aldo/keto reductase, partial [Acidobacteriaceae bacterium]|nr:aldo/keto reductase [Acidobacteriaceae bacterium]